jgi:hypothetical protein
MFVDPINVPYLIGEADVCIPSVTYSYCVSKFSSTYSTQPGDNT